MEGTFVVSTEGDRVDASTVGVNVGDIVVVCLVVKVGGKVGVKVGGGVGVTVADSVGVNVEDTVGVRVRGCKDVGNNVGAGEKKGITEGVGAGEGAQVNSDVGVTVGPGDG